eukprot:Phypoly_transcript_01486.p1 GENE.Phypoly_transcript_01486~~Phypoly_transcript_01486.p1  ORF type:complete len:353 (+),score=41.00 Phypoly_transcript_01486:2198-3256(+)
MSNLVEPKSLPYIAAVFSRALNWENPGGGASPVSSFFTKLTRRNSLGEAEIGVPIGPPPSVPAAFFLNLNAFPIPVFPNWAISCPAGSTGRFCETTVAPMFFITRYLGVANTIPATWRKLELNQMPKTFVGGNKPEGPLLYMYYADPVGRFATYPNEILYIGWGDAGEIMSKKEKDLLKISNDPQEPIKKFAYRLPTNPPLPAEHMQFYTSMLRMIVCTARAKPEEGAGTNARYCNREMNDPANPAAPPIDLIAYFEQFIFGRFDRTRKDGYWLPSIPERFLGRNPPPPEGLTNPYASQPPGSCLVPPVTARRATNQSEVCVESVAPKVAEPRKSEDLLPEPVGLEQCGISH